MKINLIYSNTDLLCKSLLTPALATAECNSYLL